MYKVIPCWCTFAANVAALYYGYCLLPDGTYCLAPPPPGIDASSYYSTMPTGMMPVHSASPAPPPLGTTPPPDSAVAVPPAAAAPPPASAPVSHATPSAFYSSRYVYPTVIWSNVSSRSCKVFVRYIKLRRNIKETIS